MEIIIEHFTFLLYQNVCRSLFERHKLLFAFLLCARILLDRGVIRLVEFNFLLNGGKIEQETENPEPKWISARMWMELQELASVPTMKEFVEDFPNQTKFFRTYYESYHPHKSTWLEVWARDSWNRSRRTWQRSTQNPTHWLQSSSSYPQAQIRPLIFSNSPIK